MADLPLEGGTIRTEDGEVRAADQSLLRVLALMNDIYGWVQVLEVLRDHVISRYPAGPRYAAHVLAQQDAAGVARQAGCGEI